MEVTIRPATRDDVHPLSELAQRTWAEAFGGDVAAADVAVEVERTRSEEYFRTALHERTILVAEAGGVLVGYVQFGNVEIAEVDVRPGDQGLQRLYVDRAFQGRGLGRRLLEAALVHPRLAVARRVYLTVWEENEPALRLYRSAGFTPVGTTAFRIGDGPLVEDLVLVLER
jgi:ribosomal protein S18 acetylase RimI-like enzyme